MNEIILKVEDVTKEYRLGQIGATTFREEIQRFNARLRKKDDPKSLVGSPIPISDEKFKALDKICFQVKRGERLGIIGHNGAGKSTLLKLISRITVPSDGWIGLNGRVASMLEVGTGFHTELTGRENIYLNGTILGMKKREIDSKLEEIIEFSECRQFIDTPVKRYSSGMFVKLAFSVAAHLDAEIMIMDEVLAVGDMAFQQKCLNKMREVSMNEGRTILYVSHHMDTIRQLCDRCIVLNHGHLIYDGDVEKGIARYVHTAQTSFEKDIDLTKVKHLEWRTGNIVFTRAIVESEGPLFESSDSIQLKLFVESKDDYEDVRFMFVLFFQDGTRLAKTESENFFLKQGNNVISLSVPCEGLADGMYYLEFNLLRKTQNGLREKCDCVPDALFFQIQNQQTFGMKDEKWNSNLWGHFMMKPLQIIAIKDK